MIDAIIKDIIKQLSAVKELKYIADDWGQVDRDEDSLARYPLRYPAVLITPELGEVSLQANKDFIRERVSFTLRLFDAPSTSATASAPGPHADASLQVYFLKSAITKAMQQIGLSYKGFRRAPRIDGLREIDLLFECSISE
ncbi:hypothetical protein [Porphyromonas crevioricanis]|uniref:DUF3168 domain-containing protein n=1 Tax=Porphyromonas crevioricanis TaxID=393921 RepID=A0AB34PF49_9PORP|nr:hypothetical protein [Porphyromonas crevioricanis]KGN94482.1 hypothetical protein HQ38_05780 [Porphyromonas crevioricanis]